MAFEKILNWRVSVGDEGRGLDLDTMLAWSLRCVFLWTMYLLGTRGGMDTPFNELGKEEKNHEKREKNANLLLVSDLCHLASLVVTCKY
jgi:hypothetical protein